MNLTHWYLHVDLDAFFASVEQMDHPEYRGKPVIVGGKPEDRRSVVSTASYEARKFGVHSAMPTYQAYKLCPQGIYVHGRMERYAELSYKIMSIFKEYSPDVNQMSIDEAFIDLTGTERLFGPPEETAKKIKAHVKKDTGLTVSVGLATTKYLAKIASGFSKPDGFYYIHKGDEEKFMLSLPLNKVWGLGPKSLELINSKGIKTTQDIFNMPYDTLEFLFGKNMGSYLYDTVRGGEKEVFGKKPKSHSISAETTFPYDLTDIYTIETELLELCHGVFFRLLKENSYSRTAFVKIRYEDFSTCSIQETLNRNIMTLDSYFEIIKRLFEKKYEPGRGIRLLGVGFENLETEDRPYQQELFGNNDEKKQAVEKAILKLEKKHPEIKVRKARTLKDNKSLKAIFLCTLIFSGINLKAQAKESNIKQKGAAASNPDTFYIPELQEEAPESLFQWQIDDKNNVDFTINGFWKGEAAGSLISTFGKDTDFSISASAPVIKQEVEISAWVFLNKHWYFEVDFAEEFAKNTIAMGYISNDFVRTVRIANRDITIQNEYSADAFGFGLKSGNNQAPGASAHFQSSSNKLEADVLVRYDMTNTQNATFYGMNQVQDVKISPDAMVFGRSFNFPKDTLTADQLKQIKDIYVESKQGLYTDASGFHYKKLSESEYTVHTLQSEHTAQNVINISPAARAGKEDNYIPRVLVTFINPDSVKTIISQTGTYEDPESFAGKIQQQFNQNRKGKKFNLKDYTASLYGTIEGQPALIIQNSTGFNPYLAMNTYDCGLTQNGDISVINNSSETTLTQFTVSTDTSSLSVLYEDYFIENHLLATVINKNLPDNLYPFADTNPEIYLNLPSDSDISILVRTYSPVSEYQIGTNASAGTVQVYKNNVLDTTAQYNQNTGIVSLSAIPSSTDKIYITWQEDINDYSRGSLSAGAGVKYHFTPQLTGDLSLTTSWPLSFSQTYSLANDVHNGFAALAGGIEYKGEHLTLSDKAAFALQKDNAASALLVCAQPDNVPKTYYLEQTSGHETKAVPVINMPYSYELSINHKANSGSPNGQKDAAITGYKIPLSWEFSEPENWASVDIHLGAGDLLKNSSQLNLAIQPQLELNDNTAYEVYLQLGINASPDFEGEDSFNISTWLLKDLDLTDNQWQTLSIYLDDKDRAKLTSNYDARIIVKPGKNFSLETETGKGTIYIGPYEPVIQTLQPAFSEDLIVTTSSVAYDATDYSSVINWIIPSTTDIEQLDNTNISASTWFTAADFSQYNNISLDFALSGNVQDYDYSYSNDSTVNTSAPLTLILDDGTSTAVKAELYDTVNLFTSETIYHNLKLNLKENKVYIDQQELSPASYSLYINKSIIPVRQTVIINTLQSNKIIRQGSLYINKLLYTDTQLYYNLQNLIQASYKYRNFETNLSSKQITGPFDNLDFNIISNADAKASLGPVDIKGDLSLTNSMITNAGHSINTSSSILNMISLEESYRYNNREQSLYKNNLLKLDFNEYKVPYSIKAHTDAQDQINIRNQNSGIESSLKLNDGTKGINFDASVKNSQKLNKLSTPVISFNTDNYFYGWKDISLMEFSSGEEDATSRNTVINGKLEGLVPYMNFKPSVLYELSGDYKSSTESTFTDITKLSLSLPVQLLNNSLSFTLSRNGGGKTNITAGGTYITDTSRIFDLQQDRTWIYSSIPFYELFQKDLKQSISADYSTKYELAYKRKLYNSFKDLYIPSSASFGVTRSILNTNTASDVYQFKTVITSTSLNNFGSDSSSQLFTWFKQEEIISSLTGILKLPVDLPENLTYQLTAYVQTILMITEKQTLSNAVDFSIDNTFDWTTHYTMIYARPGVTSLITALIDVFNKSQNKTEFIITRKDSFNMELGLSDKTFRQKYNYMHSVDLNFMKYFTITTGIGAGFTSIQNSVSSLSLDYSIGGKAEF